MARNNDEIRDSYCTKWHQRKAHFKAMRNFAITQYLYITCYIKYLYNIVSFLLIFIPPKRDDLRHTNKTISLPSSAG